MIEQWVIDRLNLLEGEKLKILADSQRVIRAGARAVDGLAKENGFTVLFCSREPRPAGAISKEWPSAGITIVTGIVSALIGRPVRYDIAMTGEITIMGKVLAIGGVLPSQQAAIDAGCNEVIVHKENEQDVQMTPD
jgi:Lon protease (S16) C-terminal proteolytic domain